MKIRSFLCSIGLVVITAGLCPAGEPWEASERSGLIALNRMTEGHELDQSQIDGVKYALQEQREMIELFARYGLLGDGELQKKMDEIADLTRSRLDAVLTSDQIDRWKIIETKVNEPKRDERRAFAVFSVAKP